jgi:hypothetical protein
MIGKILEKVVITTLAIGTGAFMLGFLAQNDDYEDLE